MVFVGFSTHQFNIKVAPIQLFPQDPSLPVRRNAGHVVSTVANTIADNYSELLKDGEMPELHGLWGEENNESILF